MGSRQRDWVLENLEDLDHREGRLTVMQFSTRYSKHVTYKSLFNPHIRREGLGRLEAWIPGFLNGVEPVDWQGVAGFGSQGSGTLDLPPSCFWQPGGESRGPEPHPKDVEGFAEGGCPLIGKW